MKKGIQIKKLVIGVMVLTLSLLMIGCGKSESPSSNAPAASESKPAEEKVIKVGMMATLKPFVFTDEKDKIIGYDIDMLNEIDARLPEYKFEYQNLQFSALFSSLQTGAVDMLTGTIGRNAEREAKYLVPPTDSGRVISSLVVKKDSNINSFEDMGGKTIPMDPARYEFNVMKDFNTKNPEKAMIIKEMADVTQADSMKMVADGRVDAALIYRDSFPEIQKELNLPVRMSDVYAVKQPYCQLINPKLTEFGAAYSKALQSMLDDGTLSKLSLNWLGYDMFAK